MLIFAIHFVMSVRMYDESRVTWLGSVRVGGLWLFIFPPFIFISVLKGASILHSEDIIVILSVCWV